MILNDAVEVLSLDYSILVEIIKLRMFCCQPIGVTGEQKIEYQDPPLKLRLIQSIGLSDFMMNNLVFARPKTRSYSVQAIDKEVKLSINGLPYVPPIGYSYRYTVLKNQSHSVPVVLLSRAEGARSTIVYSHGNSSDLGISLKFITLLAEFHAAHFVVYDYTGYGLSEMKDTTPVSISEDLEIVLAWIDRPLPEIILLGFSLGCYPTAKAASKHKVKAVALLAPMASLFSIFEENITPYTFFKEDEFCLLEVVENIESHIFLAHSRDDGIIPFRHSQIIYERYVQVTGSPFIEFLELKEVAHNGMHQYLTCTTENSFQREFFSFLRKAEKEAPVIRYGASLMERSRQELGGREELRQEALGREKERSLYSNTVFSKIRSNLRDWGSPPEAE